VLCLKVIKELFEGCLLTVRLQPLHLKVIPLLVIILVMRYSKGLRKAEEGQGRVETVLV
jgi:hypothetical protein